MKRLSAEAVLKWIFTAFTVVFLICMAMLIVAGTVAVVT